MNRRMVFYTVGQIIKIEALLLALPLLVSVYYNESKCSLSILTTIGIALALGFLFTVVFKPSNRVIYAKEGFVTVAMAWFFLSLIGSLPFVFSKDIPLFFDAFFETVSGFTTTGSSILTNVEAMSKSLLFWRSFTHWIGGMGILVFVMAIIPNVTDRSMHIIRAEMPGPIIGKLLPRAKDTAKILYIIYIVMTIIEIVLLRLGGMPLFDSVLNSFGTAGTGGFGIKADSIAGYNSYLQWVIAIFMFLFGVNFNLYFLLLMKKIRTILKSTELWTYIIIVSISTAVITANIYSLVKNFSDALRLSFFQVSSIITTTGYATTDFNLWPGLSKSILLVLMFIGACAGSTAGGLKVSRFVILLKLIKNEFRHVLNPHTVNSVRFEGKPVDKAILKNVLVYFAIYIVCFFCIFLVISFEPFDMETNFSAAATCFNNVGPGFSLVGPDSNFSAYSSFSKVILSFAMLLGRLEIFPILIALTPSTWVKK